MRASTALKKDFSNRKLSTSHDAPPPFDPEGLVSELLSLGNEKITLNLARRLGEEVQAELRRRSPNHWTPEIISEIVQFKLEELGLLEIRPRKLPKGSFAHLPRGLFPTQDEEVTGDLPPPGYLSDPIGRENGSDAMNAADLRKPPSSPAKNPLPPRVELQLSAQAVARLGEKFPYQSKDARSAAWSQLLQSLAASSAQVESRYPSEKNPEVLAVEFFNAMANQEFLPHAAELLEGSGETPAQAIRITIGQDLHAQAEALAESEAIWQSGTPLCLDLCNQAEVDLPTLRHFLEALDRSILEGSRPDRQPVALQVRLHAEHPEAVEIGRWLATGHLFTRIELQLVLNHASFANDTGATPVGPEVQSLLADTWRRGDLQLAFLHEALQRRAALNLEGFAGVGGPGLQSLESAQAASLNLAVVASGSEVDWIKLRRIVRTAVHFLENRIDAVDYPTETVRKNSQASRKIALGVMGFAELLIKLGIPYDSEDAVLLAEKVMRFLHDETQKASLELAKARDVFPHFSLSHFARRGLRTRHAALSSIVSSRFFAELFGVTPGVQALEQIVERDADDTAATTVSEAMPLLKQISLKHRVWTLDLETDVLERGSVRQSPLAPKPLRRLFGIRSELDADWEMRMTAAFQKFCDGAVAHRATELEGPELTPLLSLLQRASEYGLKSLTVPRNPEARFEIPTPEPLLEVEAIEIDAAAEPEPEALAEAAPAAEAEPEAIELAAEPEPVAAVEEITEHGVFEAPAPEPIVPRERPEVLSASVRQIQTACGPMTVTLARDERGPFEIQARLGKSGSCESAQAEAISRLSSLLMGVGVEPNLIYAQLKGIRCPGSAVDRGDRVLSCADAIATALKREFGLGEAETCAATDAETMDGEEEEVTAIVAADSIH